MIPDPNLVAVKNDAWLPAMQMVTLYTVVSFAQVNKGAHVWLSDKEKEIMEDTNPLFVEGMSGFAIIFFSVACKDPKTRHRGRIGLLWS